MLLMFPGVGRLIAEAKVTPVVIPFWHEGERKVYNSGIGILQSWQ